MSKGRRSTIEVQGAAIAIVSTGDHDFLSLTDMAKKFGDDSLIYNWMRNRNTLELIGIWEQIHNRDFNGLEFETFRKQAGLNSFSLTPRKWRLRKLNEIAISQMRTLLAAGNVKRLK